MTIEIKPGAGATRHFTQEQLLEIARSLVIAHDSVGIRPVCFSVNAPADTSVPWQETDPYGNPTGNIRFYRAGGWQ